MAAHIPYYTKAELDQYFDRIALPTSKRLFQVSSLSSEDKLAYLSLIYKHHLIKIPWENISQHYSLHRRIIISYPYLHRKIVTNTDASGRGGYCLENNSLLFAVLRSLGFSVYTGGSRVYFPTAKAWTGWGHIVNLITIGDTKYLCDVGYGANAPTSPLPLAAGEVRAQIAPAQTRLLYEGIDGQYDGSQRMWVYSHRIHEDSPWNPQYCFTELEFTFADIKSINAYPEMDRHVFFAHKVMAIRFTTTLEKDTGEDGRPGSPGEAECEGDIDGAMILDHDVIKWRRGGKKAMHFKLSSEAERIKALRDYFGIEIGSEEAAAIMGSAAQLDDNGWGVFYDKMLYREDGGSLATGGAPAGSMPA